MKFSKLWKFSPKTYKLDDSEGNSMKGDFYREKVQKVEVLLVEELLRISETFFYLKRLKLSNNHNPWT